LISCRCRHNHRLSNSNSGPPWKFPCLIGRHYHSTEIPHLHFQRLVRRTSAQIESNLFPCHSVLFDLYMSATNFTIAHLHPCLCHPRGGRQGWKRQNQQRNSASVPFVLRRPACKRRSTRRVFVFLLLITTKPARFAELAHLPMVQESKIGHGLTGSIARALKHWATAFLLILHRALLRAFL
jgi:hypothetical protein